MEYIAQLRLTIAGLSAPTRLVLEVVAEARRLDVEVLSQLNNANVEVVVHGDRRALLLNVAIIPLLK